MEFMVRIDPADDTARALLLPRRNPGRRSPLWQQRQRASQLLEVAREYPDFPITLEAMRECLDDAAVRVSYRQASLIIKRALRAVGRSGFGLDVGRHQSNGTFGIMGLAMMTARTFGDAVAIGVEVGEVQVRMGVDQAHGPSFGDFSGRCQAWIRLLPVMIARQRTSETTGAP